GDLHLYHHGHPRRAARAVSGHRQGVCVAAVRDVALRLRRAGRRWGPLLRPGLAAHAAGPDAAAVRRLVAVTSERERARRAAGRAAGGHAVPGFPGTATPPVPRAATDTAGRRRATRPWDPRVPREPASAAGARSPLAGRAPAAGVPHAPRPAAPCPRCPGTPRRNKQGLVRRLRPA